MYNCYLFTDGLKLTHFVGEKNLKLIKEKIRLIGLEMDKEELINAKMIEKRLRSTFQQTNKLGICTYGLHHQNDPYHLVLPNYDHVTISFVYLIPPTYGIWPAVVQLLVFIYSGIQ